MSKLIAFLAPTLLLVGLVFPFVYMFLGKKQGENKRAKRAIRFNLVSFFGVLVMFVAFSVTNAFAAEEELGYLEMMKATPVIMRITTGAGVAYLGAALAAGLSALGAGIAIASAIPAAINACDRGGKIMGKSLLFIVLGETIALYGLGVAILIINSLK